MKLGIGMTMAMAMVLASAAGPTKDADAVRTALGAKADAAAKDSVTAIAGKDGWLFFAPELHYLSVGPFWGADAAKVSRVGDAKNADPLPAIEAYKKALEEQGIDLLVVPVPAKAAIYPDKLVDGAKIDVADRVDAAQGEFIKKLNDEGIHTLDLTPAYLQYRADHPDAILYSKTDTHWAGAGIDIATDLIAAEVKKEKWFDGATKTQFATSPTSVSAKGDLVSLLKSDAPGSETFNLTAVTTGGAPVKFDSGSPLLILGDSHALVYSSGLITSGAGMPESLAAKTGINPDVFATEGSGAAVRRNLVQTRGGAAGKKLVVWVFTAREFTETQSGWKIVPAVKPGG